ncbi:MAG: hypothetical protein ACTSWG_02475 [Candidatus Helarchaeota archaeon]
MTMTIKELDEYCRLHNFSIIYNRQRIHCGFRCFDYRLNDQLKKEEKQNVNKTR